MLEDNLTKVCTSSPDIDECLNDPCSDGQCVNTVGSFKCVCPDGMELMEDGVSCSGNIRCIIMRQHIKEI